MYMSIMTEQIIVPTPDVSVTCCERTNSGEGSTLQDEITSERACDIAQRAQGKVLQTTNALCQQNGKTGPIKDLYWTKSKEGSFIGRYWY